MIKEHSWFNGFDFNDLYDGKLEAPWRPNIKDEFDISNFDDYSDDPYVEYQPYTGNQDWCKDF